MDLRMGIVLGPLDRGWQSCGPIQKSTGALNIIRTSSHWKKKKKKLHQTEIFNFY